MYRPVCRFTNYGGTISGNPPDQISGSASCEWWSGTWQARRRPAVAAVTVEPSLGILVRGNTRQLVATARAADGLRLIGRAVTWSSSNPVAATVSPAGLVTASSVGSSTITAVVEGRSASTQVPVDLVRLSSIWLGWYQSCGLTVAGTAYCWGYDGFAGTFRTGDGVRAPAAVPGSLLFRSIGGGYPSVVDPPTNR